MFSIEGRTANDPGLKAALLSSSYACWRNKQNPYPVYLPSRTQAAVLPRPLKEMARDLERLKKERAAAYAYVKRAIARELRITKDPYYPEFCSRFGAPKADDVRMEDRTTDIEITFEQDMTTVVTVRSRFEDVSRAEAEHLIALAHPSNWHYAVPTFFLASTPVRFDDDGSGRQSYVPLEEDEELEEQYLLLERVEWEWTPGVPGGVVNVLAIAELDPEDKSFVNVVVDKVLEDEETRTARDHIKGRYWKICKTQGKTVLSAQYEYELEHCIQSKFIASWDVGGLDTDDGTYRAVWIPTWNPNTGDFLLQVEKRFRYSRYAGVLPDVPTVVNMLAPAVVSMLMKQLGYEGIRDELARLRKGGIRGTPSKPSATRARERSLDQRRKAS